MKSCRRFPALLALLLAPCAATAGTWSHWRGPWQNGSATDTHLPATWSSEGENLLWHAPYGARTAPIVQNGCVYLITGCGSAGSPDMRERVVCLDLATGRLVWEHRFEVALTDVVFHRIGWANLCGDPETGNIYAHGVQGLFLCFDRDGKVLWSRSLTEDFGRISGYGGRMFAPMIEGDRVIMGMFNSSWGAHAKPVSRLIAMDKRSGDIVWWSSPGAAPIDTVSSIPVAGTVDGVRLIFGGLADGSIQAVKASTGEPVWNFRLSKGGMNTSVIFDNGRVYASHSEENLDGPSMGRTVCIDARGHGDITASGELWRVDGLGSGYASPALCDGLLYVADNSANLHCLDAASGEVYWSFDYGNTGKGSPLIADGKAYIGDMSGSYHTLEVSKAGCRRLCDVSFAKSNGAPIEVYGTPVVVDGKVLLPTLADTYCIGLPEGKAGASAPEAPVPAADPAAPAAFLQVVPAEVMLPPGGAQKFVARTYDAKGNLIGATTAEWLLEALGGTIDAAGMYHAETSGRLQAGVVKAVAGALTNEVRVRVLPTLPYREDFESVKAGLPPAGWITSKLKCQVTEIDGQKVLRKLAENPAPPFARMNCFMLPAMDIGYTVQADMLGKEARGRFKPDMGLINARYQVTLMGTTRTPTLRLVAWDAMPRLRNDVAYPWQVDTWYTLKVAVARSGAGATVRAKVWPRGEAEPSTWTAEMTDAYPHAGGSPGLYAYSTGVTEKQPGTEVYFDNIAVTADPSASADQR